MKPLQTILTALLLISTTFSYSQRNKEAFFAFDENWKDAGIDKATYFIRRTKVSDTCWQFDYYHVLGPMLWSIQYNDKKSFVKNGDVFYYNKRGLLDSLGSYYHDKKNGVFMKTNGGDSVKWKWKYTYQNDSLISVEDMDKRDTTHYADSKEAEYAGGIKSWYRYLSRTMRYPDEAVQNNIQGQVKILFMVTKDGTIAYPMIAGSVEHSLDQAALSVIVNSGNWEPAFQNGHHVASYKLQPLNFKLEMK